MAAGVVGGLTLALALSGLGALLPDGGGRGDDGHSLGQDRGDGGGGARALSHGDRDGRRAGAAGLSADAAATATAAATAADDGAGQSRGDGGGGCGLLGIRDGDDAGEAADGNSDDTRGGRGRGGRGRLGGDVDCGYPARLAIARGERAGQGGGDDLSLRRCSAGADGGGNGDCDEGDDRAARGRRQSHGDDGGLGTVGPVGLGRAGGGRNLSSLGDVDGRDYR